MEPEEVLEQVVEQEPVVEEPAVVEEPVAEPQPEAEPAEEVVQEPVAEPVPVLEPHKVGTNGKWVLLEDYLNDKFENGKTYHIKVQGRCQFMISEKKPVFGIETNEITFTKEDGQAVWIKTGK